MKKILLATTALVGFAGVAAAEVNLSGYAEIGIYDPEGGETQFHSDIDVKFSLSAASDSGLEFGATIDLDEVGDDCRGGTVTSTTGTGTTAVTSTAFICTNGDSIDAHGAGEEQSVWVSGSFGKVTLGDTDGALDWANAELSIGTALADDHTSQAGYYSFTGLDGAHDGQVARYEYSFGDFGVAVSAEIDDTGVDDPTLGIGFKYAGDMGGTAVEAGIGYQAGELGGVDIDATALSLGANFSGFTTKIGYATGNIGYDTSDWDWVGLTVGYSLDAWKGQIIWGEWSGNSAGAPDADGFGLLVNYDMGGGAVAMFGYGDGDSAGSPYHGGGSTWSAGLGLSF
jgi:outer membrane protein OmpU